MTGHPYTDPVDIRVMEFIARANGDRGEAIALAVRSLMASDEYEAGYRDGGSSVEADLMTLLDEFDISLDGKHPIAALREALRRAT